MIQDIFPYKFDNSFKEQQPDSDSYIVIISGADVLISERDGEISLPRFAQVNPTETIYLFSIDGMRFFYAPDYDAQALSDEGYAFVNMAMIYRKSPKVMAFAAVTAHHICAWYRDNRFCGRCGGEMVRDTKERMMRCDKCKTTIYPRLNPVVIVGVKNGEELLLTKYAGHANVPFYALIAGFAEVGEPIEGTVQREVMEEVGLRVKNIRYFASQPWAMSQSLLMGFFCDVDGSPEVTVDRSELSEAVWMERSKIEPRRDDISLTSHMMCAFADGTNV